MDTMILQQVNRSIRRHGLFGKGERVLVCVSGGADSMALLSVLHELASALDISLAVCHFNHLIRGREADKDETFVRNAAERLGMECMVGRGDVVRLARERGQSLEMVGREARYNFFKQVARASGCTVAATAHTADDQAETILLRIARGAGGRGLRGIPRSTVWKGLRIVRPMLDADRRSIIRFLEQRKICWREDASNRNVSFLRNRVRHEIIPMLESRLNPRIRRALLRLGAMMEEDNDWLDAQAEHHLSECTAPAEPRLPGVAGKPERRQEILCDKLASCPPAARKRVLRQWLVLSGMPHEYLDFESTERLDRLLVSRRTSKSVTLPGGWIVLREYRRLAVQKEDSKIPQSYSAVIKVPGETFLPDHGLRVVSSIGPEIFREQPAGIGIFPVRASLNPNAWRRRKIIVRSWLPGDRMHPLGVNGSKKIQDIFVDMRIPKYLRHSMPLFECRGEIIWLPGYRIARGWEVPDSCRHTLQLIIETA